MLTDRLLAPFVNIEESVILTGFWRSGTTWIQRFLGEVLGAKTVFEPLEPVYPKAVGSFDTSALPRKDIKYLRLFMPFPKADFDNSRLRSYLEYSMRSRLRGNRPRRSRQRWTESFRRVVVVKSTRLQLCLDSVQRSFDCHVVHVRRDPRAVLASIRRNDWGGWMKGVALKDLLLSPQDGRSGFFSRWKELIIHLDRDESDIRIIGYWALTEKFVEHLFGQKLSRAVSVRYENIVTDPIATFVAAGLTLDLQVSEEQLLSTALLNSPTTDRGRISIAPEDRIWSWKSELDPRSIAQIEDLAADLDLEEWLI